MGDPGLARNYGIHNTNGAYVALLDADDLYPADWLTKAVTYLRKNADREFMAIPKHTLVFGGRIAWCRIQIQLYGLQRGGIYQFKLLEFGHFHLVFDMPEWCLLFPLRPDWVSVMKIGIGFSLTGAWRHHQDSATNDCFYRRKLAGSRLAYHATQNCLVPPSPFSFLQNFGADRNPGPSRHGESKQKVSSAAERQDQVIEVALEKVW